MSAKYDKDQTVYISDIQNYEIGDIVETRCEFCGGAMAFQHIHDKGYALVCVVDPNFDHVQMVSSEDII